MVVIHLKVRGETDSFLYETTTTASNDAVIRELCLLCGLREKLARLAGALEELARHGPSKPESERGLDEVAEREGRRVPRGAHYCADPLGNRTGDAPPPQLVEVLLRTAAEGVAAGSKSLAAQGIALTLRGLQERLDNMRGAVTMAYPMGLPAWDPIRLLLEDDGSAAGYLAEVSGKDFVDPASATLWWAGKEFFRDQTVGDRVGRNEKTKVVARLQAAAGGAGGGGGPPMREPAVSEEERKAMMAWYFKKQEEEKKLAEDDDDAYSGARWAVRAGARSHAPFFAAPPRRALSPLSLCPTLPLPFLAGPQGAQGVAARHAGHWVARRRRRRRRAVEETSTAKPPFLPCASTHALHEPRLWQRGASCAAASPPQPPSPLTGPPRACRPCLPP